MSREPLNDHERGSLCLTTYEALRRNTSSLENFPLLIKRVIRERAWESRIMSGTLIQLPSLCDLIERPPIEGWGEKLERIRAVIRHDQTALDMFTEATTGQHGGDRRSANIKSDNITLEHDRGTSRAYSLGRVRRECDPETARAVFAGELSPHAALVKAGIREVRTVYFPRDPSQALAKIRKVMGDEYVDAMLASEAVHGS